MLLNSYFDVGGTPPPPHHHHHHHHHVAHALDVYVIGMFSPLFHSPMREYREPQYPSVWIGILVEKKGRRRRRKEKRKEWTSWSAARREKLRKMRI